MLIRGGKERTSHSLYNTSSRLFDAEKKRSRGEDNACSSASRKEVLLTIYLGQRLITPSVPYQSLNGGKF